MTISSTTRVAGPFVGDDAVVNLDFTFKVFDDSEVQILSRLDSTGVDTELVLGADYTVALNADQDTAPGGRVTLSGPLATGRTAFIVSEVSPLQESVFTNTGGFYPSVLNDALDRLHALHLENREVNSRAVVTPVGETGNLALPPVDNRIGKYLYFDANGDIVASDGTDAGTATAAVVALLASTASGKGAGLSGYLYSSTYASGTVGKKLQQSVDLDDFAGATDHAKLSTAVTFCKTTGLALTLPSRRIDIDSDLGTITLEEITILGDQVLDGATASIDKGAMLWITGTTNSPFKIRRGVSITGTGFYYPNQTDSATPTAYPATLKGDYTNGAIQFVNIERNVVYNAYKFIELDDGTSGNLGHIEIRDNYICALNRGIYISHNLEHVRISGNNFTFGFWLAATEAGARAYMRANATAIRLDKTDGVKIFDNLVYGHLNGVLTSATGNCQRVKAHSNEFDTVRYGVKATGSGRLSGSIIGNTFNSYNDQNTALQGRSISIETTGVGREVLVITGNDFEQATEDHIYVTGNATTRDIIVGPNNYISWAAFKAAGTYGALNINGSLTNVNLTGGWFMGGNSATYSYGIMGSFNVLSCSGANFESCQRPLSVTLSYLSGNGNTSTGTGHTVSDVWTATERSWGPNNFDKPQGGTPITLTIGDVANYANDAAASAGGVPVGGVYRNGSVIQIRVT